MNQINRSYSTQSLCAFVVALASVVGLAGDAHASLIVLAARRFTASACVKVGTAGTLAVQSDGSIINDAANGSPALVVECPVQSNGLSFGVENPPTATVWYTDDSTAAFSCTYASEDSDSTAVMSQTQTTSAINSSTRRTMTFETAHFSDGFVHLRCTIPARDAAGVASYLFGYEGW